MRVAADYRALVVLVGVTLATAILPREIGMPIGVMSIGLSAFYGYRLAQALYLSNPGGWALGFFIPGVHLVTLLALSSRASRFCRLHGLRIGLLGPSRQAIEALAPRPDRS